LSILFKNVFFNYKFAKQDIKALENINLEFKKSTISVILGETGSGKSTLLQLASALLLPSSGSVIVEGIDSSLSEASRYEIRKKVGIVFQYPESQFFLDTVFDEITFAPKNYGIKENLKDIVLKIIKELGIDEKLLKESPFNLSGGEKRKVAIASVLSFSPDYIAMDEPFVGLDKTGKNRLVDLILKLKDQGKGCIIVTHYLELLKDIADEVFVLKNGKLISKFEGKIFFELLMNLKRLKFEMPTFWEILEVFMSSDNKLENYIPPEELVELLIDFKKRGA
jgi:energy-coupling factor transport system ATP-binding protein